MSKVVRASISEAKLKASKNKNNALLKIVSSHPPVASMVINAIKNLKERGGSSLAAIKKYIGSTYKVNLEKVFPFIKKWVEVAVTDGTLIRTKGTGASGSFKLAAALVSESNVIKSKKIVKKPKAKISKSIKKTKSKKKPAARKLKKPKKVSKKSSKK